MPENAYIDFVTALNTEQCAERLKEVTSRMIYRRLSVRANSGQFFVEVFDDKGWGRSQRVALQLDGLWYKDTSGTRVTAYLQWYYAQVPLYMGVAAFVGFVLLVLLLDKRDTVSFTETCGLLFLAGAGAGLAIFYYLDERAYLDELSRDLSSRIRSALYVEPRPSK